MDVPRGGARGDLVAVRRVLANRRDALLARPGVTGVGVGRDDRTGGYAIVCYLESEVHADALPAELDGVPLRPQVTGEFRAQ
jgi:hypothetical protein